MRFSQGVEEGGYVPHPLPTLFVGVFVLGVGFGINRYLTGALLGYSGHGVFLIVLGAITVFSSAGSVDTTTQWKYGAGLLVAVLGSAVIATLYPGLRASFLLEQLHAGLQAAAIVVGLLAIANTTTRYRGQGTQPRDRV